MQRFRKESFYLNPDAGHYLQAQGHFPCVCIVDIGQGSVGGQAEAAYLLRFQVHREKKRSRGRGFNFGTSNLTLTTSDKRKQSAAFSVLTPTPCYTSLTMADDLQNYKLQLQQVRE